MWMVVRRSELQAMTPLFEAFFVLDQRFTGYLQVAAKQADKGVAKPGVEKFHGLPVTSHTSVKLSVGSSGGQFAWWSAVL
jgi:hypothetical protein